MSRDREAGRKAERAATVSGAYLRLRPRLRRFVARLAFSREEVDDLLQDVFVNAYRAKGEEELEHPQAYLYQVARTVCYRSNARRSERLSRLVEVLDVEALTGDGTFGERTVEGRDRLARLGAFVAALPRRRREVFVLRQVYGYSHKEIAERLGISTSTVEKHLAKALAACMQEMRRLDGEPDAEAEPAKDTA